MSRPSTVYCEGCGKSVKVARRGRVPKWCKPCRDIRGRERAELHRAEHQQQEEARRWARREAGEARAERLTRILQEKRGET